MSPLAVRALTEDDLSGLARDLVDGRDITIGHIRAGTTVTREMANWYLGLGGDIIDRAKALARAIAEEKG